MVTEGVLLLASGFVKLIQLAGKLLPEDGMFQGIKDYIEGLDADLDELIDRMNSVGDNVELPAVDAPTAENNEALDKAVKQQEDALKVLNALRAGFSQAQIDALKTAELFDEMTFSGGMSQTPLDLVGDVSKVLAAVSQVESVQTAMKALEDDEKKRQKALEERKRRAAAAMDRVTNAVKATIPEHVQLRNEISEIERLLPHMSHGMQGLALEGLALLKDEAQKLAFQFKRDMNPAFDTLVNGAVALGDNVTSAFRKMLDGTKVTMSDFKDMLKATVADVIAQIFRLTVVNQMLNAIFPGLGLQTSTFSQILGRAGGGTNPSEPTSIGWRNVDLN